MMKKLRHYLLFILLALLLAGCQQGETVQDYLNLGQKYLAEGKYEEAIVVFDKAIVIDAKCVDAYLGKADAYVGLKDMDKAIQVIELAMEQVGEEEQLSAKLAEIQSLVDMAGNEGDYDTSGDVSDPPNSDGNAENTQVVIDENDLTLNHQNIVRWPDSENKEVHLAVMYGDTEQDASLYTWSSVDPSVAEVDADGTVTCNDMIGETEIQVKSQKGTTLSCMIYILPRVEDHNGIITNYAEGDDIVRESQVGGIVLPYYVFTQDETGGTSTHNGLRLQCNWSDYVYFSGDIEIPSHLLCNGEDVPITLIDSYMYSWCNGMTRVTIPAGIEGFYDGYSWGPCEANPFAYCTSLKEINVEEGNTAFAVVDGVLFSSDMKTLISYPAQREGSVYEIPASVENVLTSAFYGSVNLERIEVAAENPIFSTLDGVLINKQSQTLIAYPSGNRNSEYTIPTGIIAVAENAFGCVPSLVNVHGTTDLKALGIGAFRGCMGLRDVNGLTNVAELVSGTTLTVENCFIDCPELGYVYGGEGTLTYRAYDEHVDCSVIAEKMPSLETLIITSADIKNFESLQGLQNLTNLNVWFWGGMLGNNLFTPDEVDAIVEDLSRMPNLTSLTVSGLVSEDPSNRDKMEEIKEKFAEAYPNCNIAVY